MSASEQETYEGGRSSVQVVRNAKGEPQWTIKVRVGDSEEEIVAAYKIAVKAHHALEAELVTKAGAAA